ncbi:helicase-related protein [Bartonella sp. DGB2]|uniref:helicase-related protein n=1 Tax=Bartonella sp. DGB2 TaxID=3388426 RepID=UPI00398FA660
MAQVNKTYAIPSSFCGRGVRAVLGSTNTGKTHFAISRLLAHSSGIIGLPLRLLAREVYHKICDKVGSNQVRLITGEEKIIPPHARYGVYTVEALPRQTNSAFVAIDEIQLAAHLDRGHIFCDRLLHLRGREETLLLGSTSMERVLRKILPKVEIIQKPRFSQLYYQGSKKISRLPPRSAIVAFSHEDVYTIAEFIRRQRGGAAVIMGALSPRTRNAQVALYQAGEVDFIVATDAIGMGLNLDIDHVAFAQNHKFDGYQWRPLNTSEIAQIAGRAGRHMRDGSFGVTAQALPFETAKVEDILAHRFPAIQYLQWRNNAYDFSSLEGLKRSLAASPRHHALVRALPAIDAQVLEILSKDKNIINITKNASDIKLLWEICALPDYGKQGAIYHTDLVSRLYRDIRQAGTLDEDYLAKQIARTNYFHGTIENIAARLVQIRCWSFIVNRSAWVKNPPFWQEKTRKIEEKLSDVLHERLTQRFIDRRTSILMKRLRENKMMNAEITQNGDIFVEKHLVGNVQGFRFVVETGIDANDVKALRAAAAAILPIEYEKRAERFSSAPNGDFAIGRDGLIRWIGQPIASLTPSADILKPRFILLADETLSNPAREKISIRLERFINFHFETILKPLFILRDAEHLTSSTRGLAFQLVEHLGILDRREVAEDVKNLDQTARAALRRLGVRFGAFHIYLPLMLKPAPAQAVSLLWALKNHAQEKAGYGDVIAILAAGRTSTVVDASYDSRFYALAGYRILGQRAVRIDILERLADLIRAALNKSSTEKPLPDGFYDGKHFFITPSMLSILGATTEDMTEILRNLGYRAKESSAQTIAVRLKKRLETPKAEPVGNWPTVRTIPAPEPIGFFDPKANDKSILLWAYYGQRTHQKKQPYHSHRSKQNSPQGAQKQPAKTKDTLKRRKENYNDKQIRPSKNVHSDKKSTRLSPTIDPDSPFAKLALLRDKLRK